MDDLYKNAGVRGTAYDPVGATRSVLRQLGDQRRVYEGEGSETDEGDAEETAARRSKRPRSDETLPEPVCLRLEVKVVYAAELLALLKVIRPDSERPALNFELMETVRLRLNEQTQDAEAAIIVSLRAGVSFFQPAEYIFMDWHLQVGVVPHACR